MCDVYVLYKKGLEKIETYETKCLYPTLLLRFHVSCDLGGLRQKIPPLYFLLIISSIAKRVVSRV